VQHLYYDCFLSYRSADHAAAETIHRRLTGAGFSVWWDKIYLEAGMRWHQEIERHCEASRVVLPLLTPEWRDSEWTRYETYGAEHIIPLLYSKGDYAAAEPLYRRATESARRVLGPDHPDAKLFAANHARCVGAMRAKPQP
jgi:hypothetical protein